MFRRLAPLLVAIMLVIASCGSGESTSGDTTPATRTPTTSETVTPTNPAPASSSTAATTPPRDDGAASLVAAPDGVWQVAPDGTATLLIDQPAAYAIDDTQGGLLYQIDRGRSPSAEATWDTIVWWIPAGETTPRELLVPTPGTDHALWLHDAFMLDGHLNVLYTRSEGAGLSGALDRLRRYDVETKTVTQLYVQSGWESHFDEVRHANGTICLSRFELFGTECVFLGVDGGTPPAIARPERDAGCLRDEFGTGLWCPDSCLLSADGTRLVFELSPHGGEVTASQIVMTDASNGDEIGRVTIPLEDGVHSAALDVDGSRILVNRRSSQGEYLAALIVDLGDPDALATTLPVAGQARFRRSEPAVGTPFPATESALVVAGPQGIVRWEDGSTEMLIAEPYARLAYELGDGTLVYQMEKTGDDDQPILTMRNGAPPVELVGTNGVAPRLWGLGDIDGNTQVIYERWPVPCGREGEPDCVGLLVAEDLVTGAIRDLSAFSGPGYGLGPAAIQGGVVLVFNTGSEIGEVGSFRLMDLAGNDVTNPVCFEAVDCSENMWLLGALSPDGRKLAFVVDHMVTGDDVEYRAVERRFGVVDAATGAVELSLMLPLDRDVGWIDYNGEWAAVSLRAGPVLLVDGNGTVTELPLEGTATFVR